MTEEQLVELAQGPLSAWNDRIIQTTRPSGDEARAILANNSIIVKRSSEYGFRVIMRNGIYSNKQSLRELLNNLGDNIGLSAACKRSLARSGPMWEFYIDVKDPDITTLLNLVEPGSVTNIHPMVKL